MGKSKSSKKAAASKAAKADNTAVVAADADAAAVAEPATVKVHVRDSKPGDDPLVVAFPRGVPSSILDAEDEATTKSRSVQFEESRSHDVPSFTWSKLKANSNRGKSIQGSDRTCTYTASNEGRGYDGRLAKLYVGVYNKEKGTLTLQPSAEKGQVFSLDQGVRSYRSNVPHSDAQMKNMSASQKRMLLFESFGSAKKQRALRSQAANVVNIESVISAGNTMLDAVQRQDMSESNRKAMEDMAAGRTKVDPILVAAAETRRKVLPTFDENATSPHKVYDAKQIAGDTVWGAVSRVTDACTKKEGNWRENLTGRGYWFGSIKTLFHTINLEERHSSYQIKTGVLLNALMKFHQNCKKNYYWGTTEELAKKFAISKEMAPRFLEFFATPTDERGREGFSFTKQLKDKRIIHMLVLYLLAHGRNMKVPAIDVFCEDLQIELNVAGALLREAGCEVKKGKNGTSVSLKTPLTFPPPKRGKRN